MQFDTKESIEINSNDINYILNISLNDKIIYFEIEEKDVFPKNDCNIYLSLEELRKINVYFLMFENIREFYQNLKEYIDKNSLLIIKQEKLVKLGFINPINKKEIFIIIPLKEKNIKDEINNIISYIFTFNQKIKFLENKVNKLEEEKSKLETKVNMLEKQNEKIPFMENQIKNLKNKIYFGLADSGVLYNDEIKLFISWLDKKPIKLKLLFDSRLDGDLLETIYEKCKGQFPIVVFIKTTKGRRFGGYSSIPLEITNGWVTDKKNFISSFDKKKKYNIRVPEHAFAGGPNSICFGYGCDFGIINTFTSRSAANCNNGTYDNSERFELAGEPDFTILNCEVYLIEY